MCVSFAKAVPVVSMALILLAVSPTAMALSETNAVPRPRPETQLPVPRPDNRKPPVSKQKRPDKKISNPLPIDQNKSCGDLAGLGITFEARPSIAERGGCIVVEPVSVSQFGGGAAVKLTQAALINCRVARQVAGW